MTVPTGTTPQQISDFMRAAGFDISLDYIDVKEFGPGNKMASAIVVLPNHIMAQMVTYLCGGNELKPGWPLNFRHRPNDKRENRGPYQCDASIEQQWLSSDQSQ